MASRDSCVFIYPFADTQPTQIMALNKLVFIQGHELRRSDYWYLTLFIFLCQYRKQFVEFAGGVGEVRFNYLKAF